MKVQRSKQRAGACATSQLDLFSASAGKLAQPASRPAVVARNETRSLPHGKPVDDPLIEYILGSPRGRGRPQKILDIPTVTTAGQPRLLDVREAAMRLGLSKSTLDKMRCSGRGPKFIRATDRAIRYDPADLDAFAAARRRQSTSESAAAAVAG